MLTAAFRTAVDRLRAGQRCLCGAGCGEVRMFLKPANMGCLTGALLEPRRQLRAANGVIQLIDKVLPPGKHPACH